MVDINLANYTPRGAEAVASPFVNRLRAKVGTFDFMSAAMQTKIMERTTGSDDADYITAQLQKAFSDEDLLEIEVLPGSYYINGTLTTDVAGKNFYAPVKSTSTDVSGNPGSYFKFVGDFAGGFGIDVSGRKQNYRGIVFDGSSATSIKLFKFLMPTNTDDVDGEITECMFYDFTRVVDFYGRSLKYSDNLSALCSADLYLDWPASGTSYSYYTQGPPWGNRSWIITNNRQHGGTGLFCEIALPSEANLPIRAMQLTGNVMDVGGELLLCSNDMISCIISNNIVEHSNATTMSFNGDVQDCQIVGNILSGEEGDIAVSPPAAMRFTGAVENSLVAQNHISHTDSHGIRFDAGISGGTMVVGNHFRNIGMDGSSSDYCIRVEGNITDAVIDNNSVHSCNNGSVIGLSGTPAITRSVIRGGPKPAATTFMTGAYSNGGGNSLVSAKDWLNVNASGEVGLGAEPTSGRKLTVSSTASHVVKIERTGSSSAIQLDFVNAAGRLGFAVTPTGSELGTIGVAADNAINLGSSTFGFKEIFCDNGTINTSDARRKTSIEPIPDVVLKAWGDVEWKRFKKIDAVAEKGDAARWHYGLIAQEVVAAFAKHGLDALDHGIVCYDEWDYAPAEMDADGNVIIAEVKAGDKYSVRYSEAEALEAAFQRSRRS